MSKRGIAFTEVAFIAVLIALVAAFVAPMLGNGEESARRATCLQNMKEIGVSLSMYAVNYDDVLPRTTEERPKMHFGAHWTYLVQPYIRSQKAFVCPADPNPSYTYQDESSQRKRVPFLSYVNNYAAVPAHDFYPVPVSVLTDPASLIIIGERRSSFPTGKSLAGWKGTSGFYPGQPCRNLELGRGYARTSAAQAESTLKIAKKDKDLLILRINWEAHGSTSNYTFADGHAQSQTLRRTLDPTAFEWGERFYPRSMAGANCDP